MTSKNKKLYPLVGGALFGFLCAVVLFLGLNVFAAKEIRKNNPPAESLTPAIPYEQIKLFAEIFENIKRNYVDEVEDKVLIEGAIKGMLSELDPHSSYLSAKAFKELKINTRGQFGGLGIQVTMEDGLVKVIAPIDDTPAMRAGIKSGDLIIKLNDTPVNGLTLDEAITIMRGTPGTPISLIVFRKGKDPFRVNLIRAIINVASVKSKLLSDNIVYLRISSFQEKTSRDVQNEFFKQAKKLSGPVAGVIIDLRSNPGGLLDAAERVSDQFLENGLVVYTKTRSGVSDRYIARGRDIAKRAPIVVLVDGGSASASEIVAGALQDNRRAIVVGQPTFGKGSVQNLHPLDSGGAIKMTIARYYTPSGKSIQGQGIDPDVLLKPLELKDSSRNTLLDVREADLQNHLLNESGGESGAKGKKNRIGKDAGKKQNNSVDTEFESSLTEKDFQLYQALTLLKGMSSANKPVTALKPDKIQ